ncbi:MAG: hypothetical protein IT207_09230 [Fimbriimonadaceae bacterium]|nr:hypothetical protein [Fimbriimonadaceae bacterium]
MDRRVEFAIEICLQAGKATLRWFQNDPEVRLKDDGSVVTKADLAAEDIVRAAVLRHFPEDGIFGEERGRTGEGPGRWVIDPIDGTQSFIAGVPLYSTLLSYEVEKVPQIGVCYFPALDELLYAEVGQGAFFQGKRTRIAEPVPIESAVVATGSLKSLSRIGLLEGAGAMAEQCRTLRTWTDAHGHALVATGRAHAMLDPNVAEWDVSAMQVIVREAGGWFGELAGPGTALSIVPAMREEVLEVLNV